MEQLATDIETGISTDTLVGILKKLREIDLICRRSMNSVASQAHLDEQTAKIDTLIVEAVRFIELSKERRLALITAAVIG